MLKLGLAAFLFGAALAQNQSYSVLDAEFQIPFVEEDHDFEQNVHVRMKISSPDASSVSPFVDTGSCGIIVSTEYIPDWNDSQATDDKVGWQYLSSSNWLYNGYWVKRNIYFDASNNEDGDDDQEVRVTVPILAVTRKIRCPSYDTANPGKDCPGQPTEVQSNPTGIRIFGIGYGRTADGQPQGTPDKNPLLHVTAVDGRSVSDLKYRPGYIINHNGITLGLTSGNTASMVFASLTSDAVGPQWDLNYPWPQLPACITVVADPDSPSGASSQPCIPGQALLDTGVGQAFLRVPPGSVTLPRDTDSLELLDGTQVQVGFGNPVVASEQFTVGDPDAPDSVRAVYAKDSSRPTFYNTARSIYRKYKVAFDPVLGRVGFGLAE